MSCGGEPGGDFCCPSKSFIRLDTNHQGITKRIFFDHLSTSGTKGKRSRESVADLRVKVCPVFFLIWMLIVWAIHRRI
jgi:hypothetical protein